MYNGPYFIPNYYPNIIRNNTLRSIGLTRKLGNNLNFIKKLNWTGLINNTSKTLNIINQTIPVIKQVGPMVNNMKSMLKIASIFKDETDEYSKVNKKVQNKTNNMNQETKTETNKSTQEDYSPTFFIAS